MAQIDSKPATPDEGSQSVEAGATTIFGLLGGNDDDGDEDHTPAPKKSEEQETTASEEDDEEQEIVEDDEESADDEDETSAAKKEAPTALKFRPLKHKGKEVEVKSEDELYALAQQGYDYTQKTQELSEREKTRVAAEAQAKQAASDYADRVVKLDNYLKQTVDNELEPDWAKVAVEDPENYLARHGAWTERQRQRDKVREERDRVEKGQRAEADKQHDEYVRREVEALVEAVPEWKDPKVAKAELRDVLTFAAAQYGFEQSELDNTSDHRALRMARDAFQFHRGKKVVEDAKGKIKGSPTLGPGAPPKPTGKQATIDGALQKSRRTGKLDDAASAIELMLK